MAKLIIKFKGEALLKEYPLTKKVTTVGRAAANDIVIDHPAVSAYHARFERNGDRYTVEDINSTNGTKVNGQCIDRLPLKHETILTIGLHILIFDDPTVAQNDADATVVMGRSAPIDATMRLDLGEKGRPAKTTMMRPGPLPVDADATMVRPGLSPVDADATMMRPGPLPVDADATMVRPGLSPVDADATMMRPPAGQSPPEAEATLIRRPSPGSAGQETVGIGRLTVLEGTTKGAVYNLTKRVTTIGEAKNAEIRIKGLFAPKVAALINRTAAGYVLSPSPGEMQPLINGKAAETAVPLQNLDIIEVIDLKLQFTV